MSAGYCTSCHRPFTTNIAGASFEQCAGCVKRARDAENAEARRRREAEDAAASLPSMFDPLLEYRK